MQIIDLINDRLNNSTSIEVNIKIGEPSFESRPAGTELSPVSLIPLFIKNIASPLAKAAAGKLSKVVLTISLAFTLSAGINIETGQKTADPFKAPVYKKSPGKKKKRLPRQSKNKSIRKSKKLKRKKQKPKEGDYEKKICLCSLA